MVASTIPDKDLGITQQMESPGMAVVAWVTGCCPYRVDTTTSREYYDMMPSNSNEKYYDLL